MVFGRSQFALGQLVKKPSVKELKFMLEVKRVEANMIPANMQHFVVEHACFSTLDMQQSSRHSTHKKSQSNVQDNIVQGSWLEKGGDCLGEHACTYFRAGKVQNWTSKKLVTSGSQNYLPCHKN